MGDMMNSKAPVALGIGIGYVLGRQHKLKWALLLGGAAATGQLGGVSTQLLQRGVDMLRSNPELSKLTNTATKLLDAGRGAAVSALNSKVEALEQKAQLGEISEKGGDLAAKGRDKLRGRKGEEEAEESDEYDENAEEEYGEEGEEEEGYENEGDEEEPEDEGAPRGRNGGRLARSGQGGGGRREPAVRRTGR